MVFMVHGLSREAPWILFFSSFSVSSVLHIWWPTMANRWACFVTDNSALVDIINLQTSKHNLTMVFVRDLVLTSLKHNILFWARRIVGVNNFYADSVYYPAFQRQPKFRLKYHTTICPSAGCFLKWCAFLRPIRGVTNVVFPGLDRLPRILWTLRFFFRLPLTTGTIALFVSDLRARKLGPSTVSSYLSAISYVHIMKGLRYPTKTFLIRNYWKRKVARL